MSFYLGVWNSPTAISDGEAAARYLALSGEQSAEPEFDAQVYKFYCRLTSIYPEVEMVPEEELDSCPWACGLDVASDHVIMAIQPEQSDKIVPHILALAEEEELVCFDPQAGQVHLPSKLRPGTAGDLVAGVFSSVPPVNTAKVSAAAGSACAAASATDSPAEVPIAASSEPEKT